MSRGPAAGEQGPWVQGGSGQWGWVRGPECQVPQAGSDVMGKGDGEGGSAEPRRERVGASMAPRGTCEPQGEQKGGRARACGAVAGRGLTVTSW